jgi:hypothetical protein
MPYYPPSMLARPYWCVNCQVWYRAKDAGHSGLGCLVHHGPGSCCHFGEEQVPAPDDEVKS